MYTLLCLLLLCSLPLPLRVADAAWLPAASQFQQLNISYKSREELQRQENVELPQWVLHPHEFL